MLIRVLIGIALAVASTLGCLQAGAQDTLALCQPADTATTYRFKPAQLAAPAAAIAAGVALAIDYKHGINKWVDDGLDKNDKRRHTTADDYLRFVPSVAHLTLGFAGVKTDYNFKERLATSVTAHAIAVALAWGLKYTVSEQRPDGSDHHSFPSGHTAIAFTGAELMRIEYGNAWGAAGYGVAALTSFLRLYNHKHWLGDVAMSAGIGILSARIAHWLLPFNRRWLGLRKTSSGTTVAAAPLYSPAQRAAGLSLFVQF